MCSPSSSRIANLRSGAMRYGADSDEGERMASSTALFSRAASSFPILIGRNPDVEILMSISPPEISLA